MPLHRTSASPVSVGLDLDGVFYPFENSLRMHLLNTRPTLTLQDLPDAIEWNFFYSWGLSLPMFLASCHEGVDAGTVFRQGDPFPDTLPHLERLRTAGCVLHVVTDRFFGSEGVAAAATHAWMEEVDMRVDSVTFSPDKTSVETDFFIDDKIENYDALDAAGVEVYLLDRPWNQHVDSRRRVKSVSEFVDIVVRAVQAREALLSS